MTASRLIFVINVAGLLSMTCQGLPHNGLLNDREISPDECKDVTTINDFCSKDCTSMINCRTGSPTLVKDCSASELFCYKSDTVLACNHVSQCGGPIWCFQGGVYPDPDNCQIYHTCAGDKVFSTVATCEDSAFDLTTHACGLPLSDVTCKGEGPVPDCQMAQQRDVLAANPAHWYKCMLLDRVLYPEQYQCFDGEVFDPAMAQCVKPIDTTETASTITTTTETTADTTTGTSTETSTETSTITSTDSSTEITTDTSTVTSTDTTTHTTSETTTNTLPTESTTNTLPTESTSLPTESTPLPTESTSLPTESTSLPTESTTLPTEATTLPTESTTLPTESTTHTIPTETPTTQSLPIDVKNRRLHN